MEPTKNENFRIRTSNPRIMPAEPVAERKEDILENIPECVKQLSRLSGIHIYDLPAIKTLELRVDTEEDTLYNLGQACPRCKQLKLNGSNIETLRDLGTTWSNLQVIWVVRTGLVELELSALPNLKELYAAFNNITSLSSLMFHERLEILDLEGNAVDDWREVEYLNTCEKLLCLTLEGNPIARDPYYRNKVFQNIPQIDLLDDLPIEAPTLLTSSECLDQPEYSKIKDNEANKEPDELELLHTIMRSSAKVRSKAETHIRPKTAGNNPFMPESVSSVLTEKVFTGNPLKAMRFKKQRIFSHRGEEVPDILSLLDEFKIGPVAFQNSDKKLQRGNGPVLGNHLA